MADEQAEAKQFVESLEAERVSFQQVDAANDGQLRALISAVDIVIDRRNLQSDYTAMQRTVEFTINQ